MNDVDDRLTSALRAPADATDPPPLDELRRLGAQRRRRRLTAVAAVSAVTIVGGVALIATDGDRGSVAILDEPGSTVASTAPSSTPDATVDVTVDVTDPATSVPASAAPATDPSATTDPVATTVPATTGTSAPATAPTTSVPPTTVPATTAPVPPPADAGALTVVRGAEPTTSVVLGTVSLTVSGSWPGGDAGRSILARRYSAEGSVLAVLADGAEVLSVTMACLPDTMVCSGDPWGSVIGGSLWVAVDDLSSNFVFEIDLATGRMVERLAGRGVPAEIVAAGDGVRLVVDDSQQSRLLVVDYRDGELRTLLERPGSGPEAAVIRLDRSGTRAFSARGSADYPLVVSYEVVDLASGSAEVAGSVTVDLVYLEVSEFVGDRVMLGDSFLGANALLDLGARDVLFGGSAPGCLLDDGTAVFESRVGDSGVDAGPISIVRPDRTVIETTTQGTGHNTGRTVCAGDHALIHREGGAITRLAGDGTAVDTGERLLGLDLLQIEGRTARRW